MSDHIQKQEQLHIEPIHITQEETLNKQKTLENPPEGQQVLKTQNTEAISQANMDAVNKIGFANELSGNGRINLERINRNLEPVVDRRYIDS